MAPMPLAGGLRFFLLILSIRTSLDLLLLHFVSSDDSAAAAAAAAAAAKALAVSLDW